LNFNNTPIDKNIEIVDLSLKIDDYLIISDLHLGYEESLNKEGLMIPKFQFEKIIKRITQIKQSAHYKKIIINGDLKHEFGKITRQEWKEVNSFLKFLQDNFEEIVLIKGNHDNFIPYITRKLDIEVKETFCIGNFLILHGHQLPKNLEDFNQDTLIIGHEHPCISLRSGERVEKIKCFLKGEFEGKKLIVMPSFNFISDGSDILHEKLLSPFLKKYSIDYFEVYGIENFEVFPFGKIKDIIKISRQFL
jgi:hypothetical protein